MANTVSNHVLLNDAETYAVVFNTAYVDTNESGGVLKVDKSTLVAPDGAEPSSLTLLSLSWNIVTYSKLVIRTDHTVDKTILTLGPGSGSLDFSKFEGIKDTGTGETGDWYFDVTGTTAGSVYSVMMVFKKES